MPEGVYKLFISKADGMYKRDYAFTTNVMEEIPKISIQHLKVDTTDLVF